MRALLLFVVALTAAALLCCAVADPPSECIVGPPDADSWDAWFENITAWRDETVKGG